MNLHNLGQPHLSSQDSFLKVRKSQKEIVVSSNTSKTQRNALHISALRVSKGTNQIKKDTSIYYLGVNWHYKVLVLSDFTSFSPFGQKFIEKFVGFWSILGNHNFTLTFLTFNNNTVYAPVHPRIIS